MKSITNIQSSQRVVAAAIAPLMETMEARQLLSAPHGAIFTIAPNAETAATVLPFTTKANVAPTAQLGEYHGVLSFSSFPTGLIAGAGGSTNEPAAFQTPVILTIQSAGNRGAVTGILNARQLGTFAVTGTVSPGQLLLRFTPFGKNVTGANSSNTVASFCGTNATSSHLTGTFLEDIGAQTLHGRLRLNFIKPATPIVVPTIGFIPTGTSATGTSISATTGTTGAGSTTTAAVDNTIDTAFGGINFGSIDISGTSTSFGDGGITLGDSLDISGTNIGFGAGVRPTIGIDLNAPVFGSNGTIDISGTSTGFDGSGISPNMVP